MDLKRDEIEEIAKQVVERLNAEPDDGQSQLVDAATLASLLSVSRATVYAHADELGAIRLGQGKRARLRFDPRALVARRTVVDRDAAFARAGRIPQRPSPLLPVRPAATRPRRRFRGDAGRS